MSRVYSSSAVLPWVMLQVLKEDPRGATKLAFRRRERKVRSERRVYHKKGRGRRRELQREERAAERSKGKKWRGSSRWDKERSVQASVCVSVMHVSVSGVCVHVCV